MHCGVCGGPCPTDSPLLRDLTSSTGRAAVGGCGVGEQHSVVAPGVGDLVEMGARDSGDYLVT
jgi:hypothetical protein